MMPITIKGIRIESVGIKRSEESGIEDIEGATYSLISSADCVLARQPIGGYGGLTLKPSPATIKALREFVASYKADIVAVLGLE